MQLTPLFDFAPMFLDPEMIIRGCRWTQERDELHDLDRIVGILAENPRLDGQRLIDALKRFQHLLEESPKTMQASGVDATLIESRRRHIDTQAQRIANLRGA